MPEPPLNRRELGYYFALAQVGMEMVVPLVIGLVLDHYLGWSPWGIIGGTVFGFVGGIWHLIIIADKQERNRRNPGERDDE